MDGRGDRADAGELASAAVWPPGPTATNSAAQRSPGDRDVRVRRRARPLRDHGRRQRDARLVLRRRRVVRAPTRRSATACSSPPRARAILDVGGESTRPRGPPVPEDEELRRIDPRVRALRAHRRDRSRSTRRSSRSPRAALDAGATYVNDVTALPRRPGARRPRRRARLRRAASCTCSATRGRCRTTRATTTSSTRSRPSCAERAEFAVAEGVARGAHRRSTPASASARRSSTTSSCCAASTRSSRSASRVLIGDSRKSFLGRLTGREDPHDRVAGDDRDERPRARARRAACSASTTSPPTRRCARGRGCYVARRWRLTPTPTTTSSDGSTTTTTTRRGRAAPQTEVTIEVTGPLALHPPRRERGRARGRPAARPRPAPRGRRVRRDRDRHGRGHRRLRRGLRARRARRPAALLQDARAPVLGRRRPPARRLRRRGGLGQGDEARAADPAAGREVSVEVWRQRATSERRPAATAFDRGDRASSPLGDGACAPELDAWAGRRARPERRLPRRDRPARDGGRASTTPARAAALADAATTCARPPTGRCAIDVTVERAGARLSTLTARAGAGRARDASSRSRPSPIDFPTRRRLRDAGPRRAPPPASSRPARQPRRAPDRPPLRAAPALRRPRRSRRRRGARPAAGCGCAEPRAADAAALAFYADAWLPAPFPRLTAPALAPTIDLTIHFRAPPAAAASPRRAGAGAVPLAHLRRRLLRGGRRALVARRHAARPEPPARAARRCRARRDDRLPRPGLQRRRPPRAAAGRRRRARRATACASSRRRRPTRPTRSATSSTSPRSSTPASRSRPTSRPRPAGRVQGGRARAGARPRGAGYVRHGPRPDRRRPAAARRPRSTLRAADRCRTAQCTARRFVLIPLLELDFGLTTPDGAALADALAALPVSEGVRRAGPPLVV